MYELRICKQKTANVTPFQAHFDRKPNTPLNIIDTIPQSSNLSYENILNHYLDAGTVPVEDFLSNHGWVKGERSDILVEEAMTKAEADAGDDIIGTKSSQSPDSFSTRNRQILYHALNNL